MKRNVPVFGLLLGLIFPILGLLVMYFVKFRTDPSGDVVSLNEFYNRLMANPKASAGVLSLCLLAELIPFIYYTNKRLDLTARGILIATMLYAVLIILLRFVW